MGSFDPDDVVAGVTIRALRSALLGFSFMANAAYFAERLGVDETRVKDVLDALVAEGFLGPAEGSGGPWWQRGEKGARLVAQRFGRRLTRVKAKELVEGLLQRVEVVNRAPEYLYRVARVGVFGSYLSDVPTLGDIDLVVQLEPKEKDPTRHKALCQVQIDERRGNFRNIVEELFWPQTKVERFLRARSGYLRFMEASHLEKLGIKTQTLYPPS